MCSSVTFSNLFFEDNGMQVRIAGTAACVRRIVCHFAPRRVDSMARHRFTILEAVGICSPQETSLRNINSYGPKSMVYAPVAASRKRPRFWHHEPPGLHTKPSLSEKTLYCTLETPFACFPENDERQVSCASRQVSTAPMTSLTDPDPRWNRGD